MALTIQFLVLTVALMATISVRADSSDDAVEQCMAVMVQPPVEGPNVTVTIAAVEPKLEELEDFYEETKKKRKRKAFEVCKRGMGDDLNNHYHRYMHVWDKNSKKTILCDTTTLGGGWLVIQRRFDGKMKFERKKWAHYRKGFGKTRGDFWLGNEAIYKITNAAPYELRIDFRVGDKELFAQYSSFKIEAESDKYRLRLGTYSGTVGQSAITAGLSYSNNMQFFTKDSDNANKCARKAQGAWWYNSCHRANLNGNWRHRGDKDSGVGWFTGADWVFPSYTEMKIRRIPQ